MHERLAKGRAKTRRAVERELAAVTRKISGVIAAIESGGDPRSLALRINELEAERRAIEARLPSRDPEEVLTLHPKTAERYRQRVADIHAARSKGNKAAREAVELMRELIDRVVVTATDDGEPMRLELVGNVAKLLEGRAAAAHQPSTRGTVRRAPERHVPDLQLGNTLSAAASLAADPRSRSRLPSGVRKAPRITLLQRRAPELRPEL